MRFKGFKLLEVISYPTVHRKCLILLLKGILVNPVLSFDKDLFSKFYINYLKKIFEIIFCIILIIYKNIIYYILYIKKIKKNIYVIWL